MKSITDNSVASNWERGFVIYLFLVSKISKSPIFFLFCSSLIIYSSFFNFILKNKNNNNHISYVIVITIYIFSCTFYSSTNLMRQFFAICFIMNSYIYFVRKKIVRFYLYILLASLFHLTSLLLIFLPIINIVKLNRFFLFLYYLLIICLLFWGHKVLIIGVNIVFPKYSHYLTNSSYGIQSSMKLGPLLKLIVDLQFLMLFLVDKNNMNSYRTIYLKIYMCGLLFTTMSVRFTQIGRCSSYFTPALYPLLLSTKKNKYFAVSFMIQFLYFLSISLLRPEWFGFFPYNFCF